MSGVATATRRYVDVIAGTTAAILDTRKTIPGMRWRRSTRCAWVAARTSAWRCMTAS